MPYESDPSATLLRLLRRRGFVRKPTPSARSTAGRAGAAPCRFDDVLQRVIIETLPARDERELARALDRLLEAGVGRDLSRAEVPAEVHSEAEVLTAFASLERQARKLRGSAPGAMLEAIGIHWQLRPIVEDILASEPTEEGAGADAPADQLAYLTQEPVEVAELMLSADRGVLAAIVAAHGAEHAEGDGGGRLVGAAKLWRDGARATARLLASVFPERVPLDFVPQTERLDLEALFAAHDEETRLLEALLANHPDADRIAVHGTAD